MSQRIPDSTVRLLIREAIESDAVDDVSRIVTNMADMHERGFALKIGVSLKKHGIIRQLLLLGCDPFLKYEGTSALARCTLGDEDEVLRILLETYLPLTQFSGDSRTIYRVKRALDEALFEACSRCSSNCVKYLLEVSARSDCYSYHDDEFLSWCTPIVAACYAPICRKVSETQVTDTVKLLIQHGCDVNKENHMKDTALHWASAAGLLDVVRLLIYNGADVNHSNSIGKTPLMLMSELLDDSSKVVEVADLLIKQGADIDKTDTSGWSAAHYAIHHSSLTLIRVLLKSGATIACTVTVGEDGVTRPCCLSLAVQLQRVNIVRTLLQWNTDASQVVPQVGVPCILENRDIALMLYNTGVDIPCHTNQLELNSSMSANLEHLKSLGFPRSLLLTCKIVIRRTIGCRLVNEDLDLNLPTILMDYVRDM